MPDFDAERDDHQENAQKENQDPDVVKHVVLLERPLDRRAPEDANTDEAEDGADQTSNEDHVSSALPVAGASCPSRHANPDRAFRCDRGN
jgi:hypothetical protein